MKVNEQQEMENLYFFTDMEQFSSHRYQYLSEAETSQGFIFGLFVPDRDWSGYGYGNEGEDYSHLHTNVANNLQGLSGQNMDEFLSHAKNQRILKNLGSKIIEVKPQVRSSRQFYGTGFTVVYGEGDICYNDPTQRYQSVVSYICDPTEGGSSNKMNDFPQLVKERRHGYKGIHQCEYHFVWHSKFACAPCLDTMVQERRLLCDEDGMRQVFIEGQQAARCVTDFPPRALLDKDPHYMKQDHSAKYRLSDFGPIYVSKSSFYEPCSIQDDIEGSPVLRFLSQVVVGTVGVLACALVFTCFKYKRLETHYSLMTND
jgi:hypothetical protein